MKKYVSALVVALGLISTNAHAWGDREQGILAGAAGLWVFQQLNKAGQTQGQPVIVQQVPPSNVPYVSPPVYTAPKPQQYCESTAVVDQFGGHRMIQYCYWK
jgi:hypothetical protein